MKDQIIVVSQNLFKYDIAIPSNAVLRVNLAWHKDLYSVRELLEKYEAYKIFLDVPIGRKKPPNFEHSFEDIIELIKEFSNVEYVAISNVENCDDVKHFQRLFKNVKIVPKIETYAGVRAADEILFALNYHPEVLMLDHQDLYSDLVRLNREKDYLNVVNNLITVCTNRKAQLLRTIGVIFSTEEIK